MMASRDAADKRHSPGKTVTPVQVSSIKKKYYIKCYLSKSTKIRIKYCLQTFARFAKILRTECAVDYGRPGLFIRKTFYHTSCKIFADLLIKPRGVKYYGR
jgi:hypothetical protein